MTQSYTDAFVQADSSFEGDTSAIGTGSTYYFGHRIDRAEILDIPLARTIQQIDKAGTWGMSLQAGNLPFDRITASFQPVNGLPFYWMLGKATHTITDVKQTIEAITTSEGMKPRFKLAQILDNSSQLELYGVIWHDLRVRYERGRLTAVMTAKALTHLLSTSAISASQSFPSGEDGLFNVFDHFSWNGTNISTILDVELALTQQVVPTLGSNGFYTTISDSQGIFSGITISFIGREADLEADYFSGTKRTIEWKMIKGSDTSKYFTFTADGYCAGITAVKQSGDIIGYTANFITESPTIVVQDEVGDSFYGVPL